MGQQPEGHEESTGAFRGGLVVVSGPSGSGKTTICKRLCGRDRVVMSVSATTRPMRPDEVHGKDYFFMSEEEFRAGLACGDFVEYNEVFKNGVLYGSLKSELEKGLADASHIYLMEIDVVGALNIKGLGYEGRYIFIKPPDMEELKKRLKERCTEEEGEIQKRLEKAAWEMEQAGKYDKVIVNDDLERAVAETEAYLGLAG
jgi:guanylate kinase